MFSNLVPYPIKDKAGVTSPGPGISLQVLLTDLVSQLPETIALNKVVVANQVPPGFIVFSDGNKIAPVIAELVRTVAINARNTSIVVTAEKFINTVTLRVEDRNNYNGYALSFSLMSLEQQARCAGGELSIKGAQQRIMAVSFSFPDSVAAWQSCLCC